MGLPPEGVSPGSDFSVQPGIPEAARFYCTHRANFGLERRPPFMENSHGIHISHTSFPQGGRPVCFGRQMVKNI
jgi:hypothetical protein